MPADIIWKSGDTQPAYEYTLTAANGIVPNLHSASVSLRLRSLTNASLNTLTGSVTIVNANTGQVSFTPTPTDTATPGNYFAEWVVMSGSSVQTFPEDGYNWILIEPNLGVAPQQVIDIAMVKQYLNIQTDDHTRDNEFLSLIQDVTPLLEAEVGPLLPTTYEEWFDGGSNVITLTYDPSEGFGSHPLIELIAASEYRGPIEYPLALIASPVFGSIYSTMLVPHRAAITRRTAGGRTLAFMPGREAVHVWYRAGQSTIPGPVQRALKEYVRTVYRWPQQIGAGSLSPADRMEAGAALQAELSRLVRMWTRPLKRYPAIA